ncbi:glycoside hydrolase family 88 protein [Flavitalea flava]
MVHSQMVVYMRSSFISSRKLIFLLSLVLLIIPPSFSQDNRVKSSSDKDGFNPDLALKYCIQQATRTVSGIKGYDQMPRSIDAGYTNWKTVGIEDWTSGFWPGILWYGYEYSKDPSWKAKADSFTRPLTRLAYRKAENHDLGFMLYCSFGNGYRLTGDTSYKNILLATADSLATLYNPKVGTILSWPFRIKSKGWIHNTIIDNMMNLELLFWASKHGGSHKLYEIAVKHAEITMQNHFRPDHSAYHVVVYDTATGKKIKGVTFQGYSDSSMWARGQSWAIYGYTMCYRETGDKKFLEFAQQVADIYLKRLPSDGIPYWDFDDPAIPNAPRDASAAAITASGLLELSTFVKIDDKDKAAFYRNKATGMLRVLSTAAYQGGEKIPAFLLHSTGHKPGNSEVDASIIYGDYYYMEALLRLKRINGKSEKL